MAAVLQLPKVTQPRGYALFAHCFTCTKDIFAARQVARSLAELGIAVLRFDFTGLGESEGEFAATNFTSNVADLIAAAEYLASEYGGPQIMIGHSLGGAATLAAASHVPAARAVCTDRGRRLILRMSNTCLLRALMKFVMRAKLKFCLPAARL